MKKHTNFVSNSSSSSFIMSGIKINTKNLNDEEIEDLYNNFSILNQEDIDLEQNELIIGKSLFSWDDSQIETYSYEDFLEKLEKKKIEVLECLQKYNSDGEKPKIYIGTKRC